jgi:very-short-patch-repair endonuclease
MPAKHVVIGQKVEPQKAVRARELRGSMTDAEKLLWQCLCGNRLGGWHFHRQQVIAGYIVDFYCHAAGLVVEVDGLVHAKQVGYDLERDEAIQGLGFRVLRIPNQDVLENLEFVLQKILSVCTG